MAKETVEEGYDYTRYRDKEPTELQARFGDWLIEKVELTFGTKKETDAFLEGVRLATALRMPFQRSPENQAVSPMVRANRSETAAPKKAMKAKTSRHPAEDEEAEAVEAPKRGRGRPRKSLPPIEEEPSRPTRRPARRKSAASNVEESPF